jgi:hypothetical protein
MSALSTVPLIALLSALLLSGLSLTTLLTTVGPRTGPALWLAGFGVYLLAIVVTVVGTPLLTAQLTSPVANVLEVVGTWLHYEGFVRALRKEGARRIWVRGWGAAGLAVGCWVVAGITGQPTWGSTFQEGTNVLFVGLILGTIVGSGRDLPGPQRVFILVSLGAQACLYTLDLTHRIGIHFPDLSHPALAFVPNIRHPIGWVFSLALLAFCEHMVVAGLLLVDRRQALAESEDSRVRLRRLNTELSQFQTQILRTLAEVLESRTEETVDHVSRVADLTQRLLTRMGTHSERYAQFVADASTLHDIGKAAIPDEILKKPGPLTAQEREVMCRHTTVGCHLLSQSDLPFFRLAARIAWEHHEHWDGGGYPEGKKQTEICPEARVVAVADTYDALVSARVYKPAWNQEQALAYLQDHAGSQFDPDVVAALVAIVTEA